MAGTVTPTEDKTRKRVTGGIFLISATMAAMLIASRSLRGVRSGLGARDLLCDPRLRQTLLSRVPCLLIEPSHEFKGVTNPSEGRHP